jgi:hypothetical protein
LRRIGNGERKREKNKEGVGRNKKIETRRDTKNRKE